MSAGTLNKLTFGQRLSAHVHAQLKDHAYFRLFWTNACEIAPGVWRSNQPSPARIRAYSNQGIRRIINLRGTSSRGSFALEEAAATDAGIALSSHALGSRRLVSAAQYLALLDDFERAERPLVIHCKSGADRAGLASAFWLIHIEGRSVAEAKAMLSLRFLHVRRSKTGVLDALLDAYEARCHVAPISLRDWLATKYDPAAITSGFREAAS